MMEKNNMEKNKMPKMAICYDFDKTLSPKDMQAFTLIPSFGIKTETFWNKSNQRAKEHLMDKNLSWMYELILQSTYNNGPRTKEYFRSVGAKVALYDGVEEWFDRINEYAFNQGIKVEHYIISSGLKEIIEGSSIAGKFRRIYASSYLYDRNGVAIWPAQAVNYTNKTQYIFRIAKGILEEWDEKVNESMSASKLAIPYENIVYIGDSETDIPCMRLVKNKHGYAIGVFDQKENRKKKVYQLYNDERIDFYAPAVYTPDSELDKYMKQIINEISAREAMKAVKEKLAEPARAYWMYEQLEEMLAEPGFVAQKDRRGMRDFQQSLRKEIDGNID